MADPTTTPPLAQTINPQLDQSESPRMQALKQLSNQLPVANSDIASQQAAARDIQLQQAVAAAPRGSAVTGNAQQIGAQQAQQAGQQMIQNAQTGLAQNAQVGGLGLQEQQQQGQKQVFGAQQQLAQQQLSNVDRLAQISQDAKKQLYDDQMSFQKDENNRTLFNTIQLADFSRTTAQNEEQYKNQAQQAQQLEQRNLEVMQTAYSKTVEDLDNKYAIAKQRGDEAAMRDIQQQKNDNAIAMQKTKNKAANNAAAWGAGGTVLGTLGGLAVGGPQGAQMGGAAGGAVGTIIGNQ